MAIGDEDSVVMLIGFVIVLIVGLNIVFFFGDITDFGGSNALTGAATITCKDIADGIKCGTNTFVSAENGCPYSTAKVCTNNCELARMYANDNRVCPTACENVCLPLDIAGKL